MAIPMFEAVANPISAEAVENELREDLLQGDAMLGTIAPILRHLLANDAHSVFSDDLIARVRGIIADLTRQMIEAVHGHDTDTDFDTEATAGHSGSLSQALLENGALVGHAHALALEWQLADRLKMRMSIDPVLPPLVQAMVASNDNSASMLAMKLLAAQARFCQSLGRMQLPLTELPADLLHGCLIAMRTICSEDSECDSKAASAESTFRSSFAEAETRLGILSRLVIGMGGGGLAALSLSHSGVAVFLTALAMASRQDRAVAIMATNESQLARLALSLRASGLKTAAIEEQFNILHPDIALPDGFDRLNPDRAAAILAVRG